MSDDSDNSNSPEASDSCMKAAKSDTIKSAKICKVKTSLNIIR